MNVNDVCDVKYITRYTNQYTTRSHIAVMTRKAPNDAGKSSGKPNLKYDKRLKRMPMMTKKNNVAVRELNDNINHKNVVVI